MKAHNYFLEKLWYLRNLKNFNTNYSLANKNETINKVTFMLSTHIQA